MVDLGQIIVTAGAGFLSALLTYLATRRRSQIDERMVYINAVSTLMEDRVQEIARITAEREAVAVRLQRMRRRIAGLEAGRRKLWVRLQHVKAECERLRTRLEDPPGAEKPLREGPDAGPLPA